MNDADRPRNVALLIDADNASADSLDPALTVLADLGTVNVRRAYGNWSKPALKGWQTVLLSHAIEPQQQFDITPGKNATDMRMTIDAMDLLFRGRVDGFGIMSSDSDFMPLAIRIRQENVPVYGFGRATTPEGFRQACTRFIDVGALVPRHENGEAASETGPRPVDDDLIKLLSDAIKASKRDDKGFANLSEVGQRAGNRSSFDARNYGFPRLSDLVKQISNFQTERRDNATWIKRVR